MKKNKKKRTIILRKTNYIWKPKNIKSTIILIYTQMAKFVELQPN